jgi:hypothetical protein
MIKKFTDFLRFSKMFFRILKSKSYTIIRIDDDYHHDACTGGRYTLTDCMNSCDTFSKLLKAIAEANLPTEQEIHLFKNRAMLEFATGLGIRDKFIEKYLTNHEKENV